MKCLKFPEKDCDLLTCHVKKKCLWDSGEQQPVTGDENGLLPCPFCGSKPEVNFVGRNGIEIKCPSCIVKYKQKTIRHDTEWLMGKMKETWNQRQPQPPTSEPGNCIGSKDVWRLKR